MSETPKVGIGIAIIDVDNRILIGKRMGSHGEGLWSLPGGHVDKGELIERTIYRELEEEIGITKEMLVNYSYHDIGLSEDFFEGDKHYITLYYAFHVEHGLPIKNCEPDKCKEWIWCDYNDLPDLMFCDTKSVLAGYMEDLVDEFY